MATPHVTHSSPAISHNNSSAPLRVADSLGLGLSGSGFLIFYFTGVTAILRQLGIINSSVRLAGASGGAATAALTCAEVPIQQQFTSLLSMAAACRPTKPACQGFLDKQVNSSLSAAMPANAAALCSGRLWVSLTEAKGDGKPDTNILYGSKWTSPQEIVGAVRLSAFIPGISSPSATLKLDQFPQLGSVYDGGFSQNLPCPPGVLRCIKVSAFPYDPSVPSDAGVEAAVQGFNKAASSPQTKALAAADPSTGPFLPLNPKIIPTPQPDIYPGLSKPLPVNSTVWGSWALDVPDSKILKQVFDIGRQDAAFWAQKSGGAGAAAVTKALQATAVQQ